MFTEHTPQSLLQLYDTIVRKVITHSRELALQISVKGEIGELETQYPKYYGVTLNSAGESVLLDIPRSLILDKEIQQGDYVRVSGVIIPHLYNNVLSLRIDVSEILTTESPRELKHNRESRITLEKLRALNIQRHPFPHKESISISLLHSRAGKAQVNEDFIKGLKGASKNICPFPVNMQDAAEIATAVEKSESDIIVLIRGGGDANQFSVFDDPRLITAFAKKSAYRVVGLGHSSDHPLLHLVADYSAATPTDAGTHIYEQIHIFKELNEQLVEAKLKNDKLLQNNGTVDKQLIDLKNQLKRNLIIRKVSITLAILFIGMTAWLWTYPRLDTTSSKGIEQTTPANVPDDHLSIPKQKAARKQKNKGSI